MTFPSAGARQRRRRPLARHAALGCALLLALAGQRAGAQAASAPALAALTEAQAKAGALFNFARYVDWPERAFASREAPFVFCLAGRDSLAGHPGALEGRSLHGRSTQVRRVFGSEDLPGCQVLYIGEAEERRQLPLLHALAGAPVLSVGDSAGFADAGGAIGITLDEGRLRFDINRATLDAAQLRASANLLRLARSVRQP